MAVEGGELLTLGNACPYNQQGYLTDATDTYYGQALAIIRPDGPGAVTFRAESPCGSAQITIPCPQEEIG